MRERIRRNRYRLAEDLKDSPQRWLFSPAAYGQYRTTLPLLQRFARGRLIDLGCGDMPFRSLIISQVETYDSLDLNPQNNDVTFVGDIQDLSMCADNSYDTILCLQVLEHIQNPFRAICEMRRILKPEGLLILSVPHLSRLHDEPHDYYRYTRYGLSYLLEQAGLQVEVLQKYGGIFCFLGHQISSTILGMVWEIPLAKNIVWFLNTWLITRSCYYLDQLFDRSGLFALGYTVLARKVSL